MNEEDRMKAVWQSSGANATPSLEDVRVAAARFDKRIRGRNALEYAAARSLSAGSAGSD